ncbi:MAG: hypothetical protein AB1758_25995, partial [Candidatus Eremiobacterota bacterium]
MAVKAPEKTGTTEKATVKQATPQVKSGGGTGATQDNPGPIDRFTPSAQVKAESGAKPLALSKEQATVVDAAYERPEDGEVKVLDTGPGSAKQLGEDDTVQVLDADGNVLSSHKLTEEEAYDLNFRSNLLKNAEQMGNGGWNFTEDVVKMPGSELKPPQTTVLDPNTGLKETVSQQNGYWEVVQQFDKNGKPLTEPYMRMRDGVEPADAVNDLFAHPGSYEFDCATPMRILNLKAQLDTVGPQDFNQLYQSAGIALRGQYDSYDVNGNQTDAGYQTSGTTVTHTDQNGKPITEYAPFDPASQNQVPGDWVFFERPGDVTSYEQGWNGIYLGPGSDGNGRYWLVDQGVVEAPPSAHQGISQTGSVLDGTYLSSFQGLPPTDLLIPMDTRPGPQQAAP